MTFQEEFAEDVGRENPASSATCGAVFNPPIWRDFPSKLGGGADRVHVQYCLFTDITTPLLTL